MVVTEDESERFNRLCEKAVPAGITAVGQSVEAGRLNPQCDIGVIS
jgi:hypothetical protein